MKVPPEIAAATCQLALVALLALRCPRAGHAAWAQAKESRVFLEQTIERLAANNLKSLLLLDRSTLEQRLAREARRIREGQPDEASLLAELRLHLSGELPEADCQLVPGSEEPAQVRPKFLEDKFALLYRDDEGTGTSSQLYKLLRARQAQQLAYCEPFWNEQLLERVAKLSKRLRAAGESLFSNLALASHKQTYEPNEPLTYEDTLDLIQRGPKPAGLVVYLSRCPLSASLLKLDDNMKNPRLGRPEYAAALQASLKPLCESVCAALEPLGRFYREHLFGGAHDHSQTEASSSRELYARRPAEVNKWLVVESACCRLMRPEGDLIVRDTYREITETPESRGMADKDPRNSDFVLLDLASKESEFEDARHRRFMQDNGHKIK